VLASPSAPASLGWFELASPVLVSVAESVTPDPSGVLASMSPPLSAAVVQATKAATSPNASADVANETAANRGRMAEA
jgi:hypothetical protein